MPILNIQASQAGLTGVIPSIAYIQTNDTEATVLTAGYLNQSVQSGLASFSLPCMCCVSTQASSSAQPKTGWYNLSYSAGNWSLTSTTEPGNVILPTVAGDFAVFSDVDGTLEDLSYSPSNAAKTKVVMANAATTIGQLPMYTDINGTIGNSGVLASSYQPLVATVTMTAAQVNGAYAAPFAIIPTQGASSAIVILNAQIITQVSTAFTAGGIAQLQYGNTVNAGGTLATSATIATANITAATSQIFTQSSLAAATVLATATYKNLGIYFTNATQAFATGTGSTVTCVVTYVVVPAV